MALPKGKHLERHDQALFFWINGPWKGRLAIVSRPRGGDWLADEVRDWKEGGVDIVVSLLTELESHELQLEDEPYCCKDQGIRYLNFPILDLGVPASVAETIKLLLALDEALNDGKTVAIHCRESIGRSGIISICLLLIRGTKIEDATRKVSSARGCEVPETIEQRQWVSDFEKQVGKTIPSRKFSDN